MKNSPWLACDRLAKRLLNVCASYSGAGALTRPFPRRGPYSRTVTIRLKLNHSRTAALTVLVTRGFDLVRRGYARLPAARRNSLKLLFIGDGLPRGTMCRA
jgi:hypothetical protein